MWDAVIAGAGPAGAVAAHVLARKGRQVLLADSIPRYKIKVGEALPGAALRLLRKLELPVPDSDSPHAPIGGNLTSWNSAELVATDFFGDPDGRGWRLDRLKFDAALRQTAVSSGATFQQTRVLGAERRGPAWLVKLDDDEIAEARWLVDATGRSATLARQLGARLLRDAPLTAIYGIGLPQKVSRLNRTIVEAMPIGWWYGGLLRSGAAMVGLHLLPRDARPFTVSPEAWRQELLATRYISSAFGDAEFHWPLHTLDASSGVLDRVIGEGWIACGDAAMSFDPISGQGILGAVYGGMLAAMTVHQVLRGESAARSEYQSRQETIRVIYLSRCRSVYQAQSRWSDSRFWSERG